MTMWTALASAVLACVAVGVVRRWGVARAGTVTTVAAAAVSAAVTSVTSAGSAPPRWDAGLLPFLVELVAFLVLTVQFAHRGRAGPAVAGAGAAALATALLVLRLTDQPSCPAAVGAGGLWAVGAAAAAAVGLHLRRQDRRRERYAAEARRAQRLRLARDLHDFVAHDVSEMVAGAQAGQVAGAAHAEVLFRRIEQAGQQALATLDHTVHMLDAPGPGPGSAPGSAPGSGLGSGPGSAPGSGLGFGPGSGLGEVPALVARFDAVGPVRAVLDLDPAFAAAVPGEVSAVAFRTVAEALTNVRRHAAGAARVSVDVTHSGPHALTVTVTNDLPERTEGPAEAPHPARGTPAGRGLAGLAADTAAVGGRVEAGPHGTGWRLSAHLPWAGAHPADS